MNIIQNNEFNNIMNCILTKKNHLIYEFYKGRPKNNFQTYRTVRDSFSRSKSVTSVTIYLYIHATFLSDFECHQKLCQESHFFLSVSHKLCHQYNKDLFIALVEKVSGGKEIKSLKNGHFSLQILELIELFQAVIF